LPLGSAADTFAAFRTAQGQRPRIVLVGANDGMLHAFDAGHYNAVTSQYDIMTTAGNEVWAYIPTQLLSSLQFLAVNQGHRYFVDGSPKAADVWLDDNNDGQKSSTEWHTVVIGGFRQGGQGLYALDVTNPQSPAFLWNYPTAGQSWSEPAIGKVRAQVNGQQVDRWVAVAGGGYSAAGTVGNTIHVIDIKTGKALWQFTTNGSVAATPILTDVNGDGYADRIYVGTVAGDLVRCDVTAVAQRAGGNVDPAAGVMADNWSCGVLLRAGAAQPFYTAAAASTDDTGRVWVFVGTGDRSQPLAIPATLNRVYGFVDPHPTSTTTLTEAQLTDVTGTNTLDTSLVSANGWFIRLRPGEKEFAETSMVFNGEVIFTTFTPGTTTTSCGTDVGAGSVYEVWYRTGGGMTDLAAFSANTPQASGRVYQVNGGVTMRPVITAGAQGSNAVLYLGNSNNLTITPTFNAPSSIRAIQYWRMVP
jgi:type IV pilus assembly protein PilY1